MTDAAAADRPIFVLAAPAARGFKPPGGGKPHTQIPDRHRQGERLTAKFAELYR